MSLRKRYPRSRVADRRNGSYARHLLTELGDIELVVPRMRRFVPSAALRAYARRPASVDRMILFCLVLELSTRKVGEALLPSLGRPLSPTTVSEVAKQLDAVVAAFHARPLKNRYCVLMLNGVVPAHKTGASAQAPRWLADVRAKEWAPGTRPGAHGRTFWLDSNPAIF